MEPLEILSIVSGLVALLSSSGLFKHVRKIIEGNAKDKEFRSRLAIREELEKAKLLLKDGKNVEAEQLIREALSHLDSLYSRVESSTEAQPRNSS